MVDVNETTQKVDLPNAVDVIIPVYRNLSLTKACIESVMKTVAVYSNVAILVVNDATPEPSIAQYLQQLSDSGCIKLLVNSDNLGFVATVNRAFSVTKNDVLLLNSDTEVYDGWLERISVCAYKDKKIATVTPFSNNATICSFPVFNKDNALPDGWSGAELDAIFADVNQGKYMDIPTGVGCCMYIRRACLDEIGVFDLERFGRGYGEESDFCMRALACGWKNVISADTFIFHHGGASFTDETRERIVHAESVMNELHPDYRFVVAKFISNDPLRVFRDAVDDVRVARSIKDAKNVVSQIRTYRDEIIDAIIQYKDFIDVEREQYKGLLDDAREEFKRTDLGLAHAEALVQKYVFAIEKRDENIEKILTELDSVRADFKRTDDGLFEAQRIVGEYAEAIAQRDRALDVAHQQMETYVRENRGLVKRIDVVSGKLASRIYKKLRRLFIKQ